MLDRVEFSRFAALAVGYRRRRGRFYRASSRARLVRAARRTGEAPAIVGQAARGSPRRRRDREARRPDRREGAHALERWVRAESLRGRRSVDNIASAPLQREDANPELKTLERTLRADRALAPWIGKTYTRESRRMDPRCGHRRFT